MFLRWPWQFPTAIAATAADNVGVSVVGEGVQVLISHTNRRNPHSGDDGRAAARRRTFRFPGGIGWRSGFQC